MYFSKNVVPRKTYLISAIANGFGGYLERFSIDEKKVIESICLVRTSDLFAMGNIFTHQVGIDYKH